MVSIVTALIQRVLRSVRQDPGMKANRTLTSSRVKLVGALIGAGAVAAMGALGLTCGGVGSGTGSTLAGSGDAPTGTVYVQPTVKGMEAGSTSTEGPPPTTLITSMAAPAVKAGG
jgi:hypothetical protein